MNWGFFSLEIVPANVREQYENNHKWIVHAEEAKLVVGSQARILYSDQIGRVEIGLAFNQAVRTGQLKGPVILSRDHHDVSGTDSPYRETANIDDGSAFCAGFFNISNALIDFLYNSFLSYRYVRSKRDRRFVSWCNVGCTTQWWWCWFWRSHQR